MNTMTEEPQAAVVTATYDPEDNKIRLRCSERFSTEDYTRVKSAGYKWAPQQKLFVAPMWTPERADIAIELAGEIGDEDTTLVDRAAERSERFEDYAERRTEDAVRAKEGVERITGPIPLGQPILVGHHSERRARKDAERIQSGIQKAANLWNTAKYWTRRAEGALRAAKYKQAPEVRARRIKGLEADRRKFERHQQTAANELKLWHGIGPIPSLDKALWITNNFGNHSRCFPLAEYPRVREGASNYEGQMSLWSALDGGVILPEVARDIAVASCNGTIAWAARWITHIDNRLAYEKAMLAEQGASALIEPTARPAQHPLLNYKVDKITAKKWGRIHEFHQVHLTKAEFMHINSSQRGTLDVGLHRVRFAAVSRDDAGKVEMFPRMRSQWFAVFLTDSKEHPAPKVDPIVEERRAEPPRLMREPSAAERKIAAKGGALGLDGLKESLKAGVQVVVADQLFATPQGLANLLVSNGDLDSRIRVLEPSAGTGNILREIKRRIAIDELSDVEVTAVEIDFNLAHRMALDGLQVFRGDFLTFTPEQLGKFDRILMNPPFKDGIDIKHIQHARTFLKEGGKLIAICANGPRQQDQLMQAAFDSGGSWEDLPDGSFESVGTNVRTAMVTFEA